MPPYGIEGSTLSSRIVNRTDPALAPAIVAATWVLSFCYTEKGEKVVVAARGRGWKVGKMGEEDDQNVPISSYKINKSWGYNIRYGYYIVNKKVITYLKVAKRVDLKSSHHTHTQI